MKSKKTVAMLLAGGEGRRLAPFTKNLAKPAIAFGAKYRIIDFPLSNCTNSGISKVGVLTQFHPLVLNEHIGSGDPWDLNRKNGGLSILPPHIKQGDSNWYKGTANAIYQNIDYIDQYSPKYVLVISGDHIYKMDYSTMLSYHIDNNSTATVAVREVPWEDASRFGIMNTDHFNRILEFDEKPEKPKSNLASMGIYIFNWSDLRRHLIEDEQNPESSNDFGKDVIPKMLKESDPMYAYPFEGYWQDVGTIESYWQTSMEILEGRGIDLYDQNWPIYTVNHDKPPTFIKQQAIAVDSIFGDGAQVSGEIRKSVIFGGAVVGKNSKIVESIIMPDARVGDNVTLYRTIVGERATIEDGVTLGDPDKDELTIVDHCQVVFE